jgi:CMP-N-acetylneuraminic acid synthetase
MKIIGVIPARGGSKGVPGKNILLILLLNIRLLLIMKMIILYPSLNQGTFF